MVRNTDNLKPFKKGEYDDRQCKGTETFKRNCKSLKEIREWTEENIVSVKKEDKIPLYEMVFQKLEDLCRQGNIRAIEMLLNYSGLKPIEKSEVNNLGNSITIKFDEEEEPIEE